MELELGIGLVSRAGGGIRAGDRLLSRAGGGIRAGDRAGV